MWDKWLQTVRVSMANHMAYKLNFVLMIIGPALVFFFVKYNLWAAIYDTGDDLVIQGYDFQEMIHYQVWVLLVALVAMGHNSMNLAIDIRMGHISKYLIYPFQFWQYHTASFIAFQMIQLAIATVSLAVFLATGMIEWVNWSDLFAGLVFVNLVSILWFMAQYSIGLIAFWLEETWVLRVIFIMLTSFLSGSIFPLEIFPKAFADFLMWTPFPYMTYVPVKLIMGTYDGSFLFAAAILTFWIGVFFAISQTIWRSGMKMYTAAGM